MKVNKPFIIFIIIIIVGLSAISYYGINYTSKSMTWEQLEIEGKINELILYNTFPNNELLVTFTNGEFVLITKNFMGSYAYLSQVPENATVKIEYKKNGFNEVYVKEIKVL